MIIAIVGPTASGKSVVALALARKLKAEIISFDSLQVYKHLNIGTAKPTASQLRRIKHHLISICHPDDEFNAGIREARSKGVATKDALVDQASQEEKRILGEINEKAQADLAEVRETIAKDVEKVRKKLQKEIDAFSGAIFEKILGRAL